VHSRYRFVIRKMAAYYDPVVVPFEKIAALLCPFTGGIFSIRTS
jgi:hypothetical protein